MTSYLLTLTAMISSVIFFSAKTDQSRVVTIQRPIVITQERKTPAYYAYQQSQNLLQKKQTPPPQNSVYLSNLSVMPERPDIQIAEMKFTKREFAALQQNTFHTRSIASDLTEDAVNLAYEKVIYSNNLDSPRLEQPNEVPELSPSKKWATVKGKFELTDGVGITDHFIEIKRVEEGRVREVGRINLRDGSYSIDIESPAGLLVARVRDQSGLIIGEDTEKLINLQSRGTYFEGPFIRVGRPNPLAVNPTSNYDRKAGSYAFANTKTLGASDVLASLFDGQKNLSSPSEEITNVSNYSSTIARVFDPSQIYKSLTTIRMTGEKGQTPSFTKKWMEGVVEYLADTQKIEFKSKTAPIMVGQVVMDGVAIAGARVEIDGHPGYVVTYMDQFMIPSASLTETSPNGYFIVAGLEADTYQAVVSKNNVYIGSQLFVAEEDSVAFQQIETSMVPRNKIVRCYDAFTSEPLLADVLIGDSEEVIETTDGTAAYRTYVSKNVSEYVVRSQDPAYAPIRYYQSGQRDFAHLPMIKENWLSEVKKLRMINDLPNAGTIIGFTQDLEYTAYLAMDAYNSGNIVYFDRNGAISQQPVTDGGFILFNVPAGINEVVLQQNAGERLYSQVIEVKSQQISVTHFSE